MELRLNMVLSFVLHATIITTAFAVIGRDSASRAPADLLTVSLLRELPRTQDFHHADQKGQAASRPVSSARNATSNVQYNSISMVTDIISPGPDSDERHLIPSVRDYTNEEKKTMESVDAAIEPSETLHSGTSSSSLTAGHLRLTSGLAPAENSVHNRAEVQPEGDNTENVTSTIRKAIQKTLVYPLFAKKRGIEGTVIAEFSINSRGYPEKIRIVKSSGSGILDTAARDTVIKASPLPSVSGSIEIPITFRLRNN